MVLNIFPRKKEADAAPSPTTEAELPEPSAEALNGANGTDGTEPKKPARRGSRGGAGRKRASSAETDETAAAVEANQQAVDETDEAAPAPAPRRRSSRARSTTATAPEGDANATAEAVPPEQEPESTPAPAATSRRGSSRKTEPRTPIDPTDGGALLRAIEQQTHQIEQQSRQIEHLAHAQEEMARRIGNGHSSAPPARVGIFIDAANIELATDRVRPSFRLNWKKVYDMLTRDRQVIRAIAYCPVHDDPAVSIETQRFVEPFLDKGFKIFTKPLKRFQDNTIKANVDIELALDIVEMLDRLDVVVLGSGDGDFQRLVEMIQGRGIRVEVIGVGSSTATGLRNAADEYIDLHTKMKELRA